MEMKTEMKRNKHLNACIETLKLSKFGNDGVTGTENLFAKNIIYYLDDKVPESPILCSFSSNPQQHICSHTENAALCWLFICHASVTLGENKNTFGCLLAFGA